jgi:hypothetical protein
MAISETGEPAQCRAMDILFFGIVADFLGFKYPPAWPGPDGSYPRHGVA